MPINTKVNNSNIDYKGGFYNKDIALIKSSVKSTSSSSTNNISKESSAEQYDITPINDSIGNEVPANIIKLYDRDKKSSSKVLELVEKKKAEKKSKTVEKKSGGLNLTVASMAASTLTHGLFFGALTGATTGIAVLLSNELFDKSDSLSSMLYLKICKRVLSSYHIDIDDDEILYSDSSESKLYLKCGLVFSFGNNGITSVKNVETNMEYYLEERKTLFKNVVDRENNIKYKVVDGKLESIGIFDNDNISSKQYGGDQMAFSRNTEELLKDPYIINELKNTFPNASMEDYELYLNKLCSVGCGYTSVINTIFNQYKGKERHFYNDFGFPMYTLNSEGNVDYNYEYLILDFFNYRNSNLGYSIQELYGDVEKNAVDGSISGDYGTGKAIGFSNASYSSIITYLKDRFDLDINLDERYLNSQANRTYVNSSNSFEYDSVISAYYDIKTNDNTVMIGSGNYKLLRMDGSVATENGGGHCMTITGVTKDGNFIVSSWGDQFIFDIKGTQKNGGNIDLHAVNFN